MYKKAPLIAFILLFLIIIDITNSLPELTYQETEPNLLALYGDSFTDGSLILRFVKQSQLDNCYEPTLYLRLVKPDGNVKKLELNDIPQNNFCRIISLAGTPFHKNERHNKLYNNNDDNKYGGNDNGENDNNGGNDNVGGKIDDSNNGVNNNRRDNNNNNGNGSPNNGRPAAPAPAIPPTNNLLDNITVLALSKKYVLLTYFCNLPTSNELCGRIIDFNGVTKSMITFNDFNGSCTNLKITKSSYDDGGFLYTCYKQETKSIEWITYSAPNIIDDSITEKYSGEIGNITRYDLTNIFSTEDRGYSIVTGYFDNIDNVQNTLPQWVVTANFITNDGQTKGSYLIYSQEVGTIKTLSIPRCNIAYQLYGYSCVLYIETNERTFINVDFTSKGAVLNSQMFSVSQLNDVNTQLYDIRNLYKGGEVFIITTSDNNISGFAYSNDGMYNSTWALPNNYTYTRKIYGINTDNTVWAIADKSNNAIATNQWTIVYSTALTTYSTVLGDAGYSSSSILSIIPGKNAVTTPDLNQITITYVMNSIEPSTGYITISQKNANEGDDLIRIKIPAKSPPIGTVNNVIIHGSVVKVTLEDGIFDRENATYIIKIDDDFVQANGQNLIGDSWEISTASGYRKNEPGDARASILLTPDGTRNYLENKNSRKTYVDDLSNEISDALAIEKGRIFIPYDRYQYMKDARKVQILLRVDIKDTKSPDQPSSTAVRNSLDKAIISKGNSAIPIGPRTKDLDSTYGAPETLDFVLDTTILAIHGKDLMWFFICGWIFYLVPILFNVIILWLLINYRLNSSETTKNWLKKNPNTALIFTLLSCIDLEALNVVSSRCAGYNELNARFTEKGRKKKIDDSNNDTANLESGEGDILKPETTTDRQNEEVTVLGNIGISSETYIDDNDDKISATKEEITEGESLSGNIPGNKSRTNKRTTEEQITEEETTKECEEIITTTTRIIQKKKVVIIKK
ncbi:glycosyltransferase family 2 protein [Rhizophagus irregularis DAOM 181602=DAOM 197198]|nr:glycosyltransferase family 2 protein [Rhizophagus irregularis DAOM 181602=DAOM 197198]